MRRRAHRQERRRRCLRRRPAHQPRGQELEPITFQDALVEASVVDAAAFSLCMENKLPIVVFGMEGAGNITRALLGEKIGTLVTNA